METIFSQYKHAVGGKLDAANYSSARAANLIKQTVSTHHSGKDYKDKELSSPELLLKRKNIEIIIKERGRGKGEREVIEITILF